MAGERAVQTPASVPKGPASVNVKMPVAFAPVFAQGKTIAHVPAGKARIRNAAKDGDLTHRSAREKILSHSLPPGGEKSVDNRRAQYASCVVVLAKARAPRRI
jgi:hypothetical protein